MSQPRKPRRRAKRSSAADVLASVVQGLMVENTRLFEELMEASGRSLDVQIEGGRLAGEASAYRDIAAPVVAHLGTALELLRLRAETEAANARTREHVMPHLVPAVKAAVELVVDRLLGFVRPPSAGPIGDPPDETIDLEPDAT